MLKLLQKKHPEVILQKDEVRFNCPFCSTKDFHRHFYYNLLKDIGHCFKCGMVKDKEGMLRYLLGNEYVTQLNRYIIQDESINRDVFKRPVPLQAKILKPMPLPDGCVSLDRKDVLSRIAIAYLTSRGVAQIDDRFLLCSTDAKLWNKIIFPITINSEIVFWASRNFIVAKGLSMYVSDSVSGYYSKGDVVYGVDYVDVSKPVIIVEGIFDALTTPNSIALLGKKATKEQIDLIASMQPVEVVVMLDADARREACTLYSRFRLRLPTSIVFLPSGDPNENRATILQHLERKTKNLDFSLDFSL